MKNRLIISLFSLLVLAQIIVPFSMIARREAILKTGEQFRFKTEPVDPYDAFRGRYVALKLEAEKVPQPSGLNLKYDQKVYAQITIDEEGFARFSALSIERPHHASYIEAKLGYYSGKDVFLRLPIDRYYMEEKSAPLAEKIYREHSQSDKKDAYIIVRVKDGLAVIEGLYIEGKRIEDLVKEK